MYTGMRMRMVMTILVMMVMNVVVRSFPSVGSLSTKSTRCLVIRMVMVMVMNVVAAEVSRRAPGALRSAP